MSREAQTKLVALKYCAFKLDFGTKMPNQKYCSYQSLLPTPWPLIPNNNKKKHDTYIVYVVGAGLRIKMLYVVKI